MKHIQESIIGSKGGNLPMSDIGIMQGDIVYFRGAPNTPYMAIMEESLYKQIMLPISLSIYDFTKGVFLYIDPSHMDYGPNFMPASYYDKSLKYNKYNVDHAWDIVEVRRGRFNRIIPANILRLANIDNLKEFAKNFKCIFKNGKWL